MMVPAMESFTNQAFKSVLPVLGPETGQIVESHLVYHNPNNEAWRIFKAWCCGPSRRFPNADLRIGAGGYRQGDSQEPKIAGKDIEFHGKSFSSKITY
jgi:hypothetical protein